jgi:hypothetical protein
MIFDEITGESWRVPVLSEEEDQFATVRRVDKALPPDQRKRFRCWLKRRFRAWFQKQKRCHRMVEALAVTIGIPPGVDPV